MRTPLALLALAVAVVAPLVLAHRTDVKGGFGATVKPAFHAERPPRGTWLALLYGGNGQGEIEPCG